MNSITTTTATATTELVKFNRHELATMASTINKREQDIFEMKQNLQQRTASFLTEVVLQGQDLIRAKTLMPHGSWTPWLSANCPNVRTRQAQDYMRVARNADSMKDNASLYSALKFLNESNDKPAKPKSCPESLRVLQLVARAAKYVRRHPISQCPAEIVHELQAELLPLAKQLWPNLFRDCIDV